MNDPSSGAEAVGKAVGLPQEAAGFPCLESQFPRQVDASAQDEQTWVFSVQSGQCILQPWVETLVWLKPASPTGISYSCTFKA